MKSDLVYERPLLAEIALVADVRNWVRLRLDRFRSDCCHSGLSGAEVLGSVIERPIMGWKADKIELRWFILSAVAGR